MKTGILNTVIWILLVVGTLVILGFVNHQQDMRVCSEIQIKIDRSNGNFFVDEEEVNAMVYHEMDTVVGRKLSEVNAGRLEHQLNNHPTIANAEVYKTLEGSLIVEVKQRTPIVRIFNKDGESYYIDSTGKVMPPSANYTSHVLVANGYISDNFYDLTQFNAQELPDSLLKISKVDDIFKYAQFIQNEPFWRIQIEQLYVNKDSDIELIPRVGNHRIVFGDATEIDRKFRKLKIFYDKGLSKTGWNEYSVINLKYANQVVCTKRI